MRDRIRTLRADEAVPDGPPKRYHDGRGYIRLRWRIAPNELVEDYEHRIVAGRPAAHLHVHHINGVKADNDPKNLQVLTAEEHARLHAEIDPPRQYPDRTWTTPKLGKDRTGKQISWAAVMKEDRRRARDRGRREIAEKARLLYVEQKLGTVAIGEIIGLDASGVSRLLRSAGVVMRPTAAASTRDTGPQAPVRQLVAARAREHCERCGKNLTWSPRHVHHRKPRSMGGSSDPKINQASNLLLLCPGCHEWVESHRDSAREDGFLVRANGDPASIPVRYTDGLYRLDDSGDRHPVPSAAPGAVPGFGPFDGNHTGASSPGSCPAW